MRYFVYISSTESFIRVNIILEVERRDGEGKEKEKQRETSERFCLRKRGNAGHFQLINTADRACWRKPHYTAGWLVGWLVGGWDGLGGEERGRWGSGGEPELLSRFSEGKRAAQETL